MVEANELSGMDPEAAREYVLAFITTLKKIQIDIAKCIEEIDVWEKRVSLARERGRTDLETQAQAVLEEKRSKLASLKTEESECKQDVRSLREQLKLIEAMPQFSVDVDLLNAQFEMLLGEPDKTAESFKEAEVDIALHEMKKKLETDDSEPRQ